MTTYRPALSADELFVVSGWSSSYRMSRDLAFVQMANYAEVMHPIVRSVLARPGAWTLVCEGRVLRGFICYEPAYDDRAPLVNYVYVAQPYRRRGHARGLFAAAGINPDEPFDFACRTKMSWELCVVHGKAQRARFNPMRARYAEKEPRR